MPTSPSKRPLVGGFSTDRDAAELLGFLQDLSLGLGGLQAQDPFYSRLQKLNKQTDRFIIHIVYNIYMYQ